MADEVEMTPVAGAEPPKANPLGTATLKPGLRLPPKPGLKLPPKPGATVSALRPGLKLPTQSALKPGLKLPAKPVIRKPGATVVAAPIPKPIASVPKPVAPAAAPAEAPKAAMETLKAVTQKLKGVTQEIPQQAILRKTGIIAEEAMSEAQKEAAKHKTARISLADAMGVAPVKEAAPMKTIRIKRPVNIPGSTASLTPQPAAAPAAPADAPAAPAAAEAPATTVTQRKTLKISRPGAVRPTGKFGIKRPGVTQATTVAKAPAEPAAEGGEVADIPDIPSAVAAPVPAPAPADNGPAWPWTLSALVQFAACLAMGALAWFLYQNTQTLYF